VTVAAEMLLGARSRASDRALQNDLSAWAMLGASHSWAASSSSVSAIFHGRGQFNIGLLGLAGKPAYQHATTIEAITKAESLL